MEINSLEAIKQAIKAHQARIPQLKDLVEILYDLQIGLPPKESAVFQRHIDETSQVLVEVHVQLSRLLDRQKELEATNG